MVTQLQKLRTAVADGDTELRNSAREGFENLTSEFRQYKDHVEKLTDQFQRSLDGIESETRSVSVLGIGLPAEITEDGVAEINEGDFGSEMADRISAVEDM